MNLVVKWYFYISKVNEIYILKVVIQNKEKNFYSSQQYKEKSLQSTHKGKKEIVDPQVVKSVYWMLTGCEFYN